MDLIKIGEFIAECRKAKGYTQASLAEQLHITNRAVSKWENGHSLPDAAIMLDLCKLLGITVTELLEGEKGMEKNEELLLEMVKQKQDADKRLLRMEIITGFICVLMLLAAVTVASCAPLAEIWRVLIIVAGLIPFLVALPFLIQIEQTAGYYECQHCKHRYVPTFKAVFMAMHTGRTRYMKCPECGKKSWQKKVLTKE
jgi:transcriptional regulator with XRE-family HTH domain